MIILKTYTRENMKSYKFKIENYLYHIYNCINLIYIVKEIVIRRVYLFCYFSLFCLDIVKESFPFSNFIC